MSREHRLLVLGQVTTAGDLELLQLAIEGIGVVATENLTSHAAAAGHLHICKWLRQQGWGCGKALDAAAGAGRRQVCEWLLEEGCPLEITAPCAAARAGHVELAEWLMQQYGVLCSRRPADFAFADFIKNVAEGCDMATLQRLHRTLLPEGPDDLHQQEQQQQEQQHGQRQHQQLDAERKACVMASAARSLTPDWRDKLEWLEIQGYPKVADCAQAAASLPEAVARLTWLRQRGYPVDEQALEAAAEADNTAALEYLLGEVGLRAEVNIETLLLTAVRGHLAALQLLHARGCPLNDDIVEYAALSGYLAIVVWLVETLGVNVPRLSLELMGSAAASGNVELLAWLHERGGRLEECIWSLAALSGCEAALEWLAAVGCPMPADGHIFSTAMKQKDMATVRVLRRLGCPWGDRSWLDHCVAEGFPAVFLRWLVEEEGCPVDWPKALEAVFKRPLNDRQEVGALVAELLLAAGQEEQATVLAGLEASLAEKQAAVTAQQQQAEGSDAMLAAEREVELTTAAIELLRLQGK